MRIAAVAVIVGGLVVGLAGQNQRPTFRSTTRLVEVSVVVHDRDGRPLAGLTANDFKISEDGKPQTIELFSVKDERTAAAATTAANAAGASPAPSEVPVPRTDFSNWREGRNTGVTAILIDRVNSVDVDQKAARDQLVK